MDVNAQGAPLPEPPPPTRDAELVPPTLVEENEDEETEFWQLFGSLASEQVQEKVKSLNKQLDNLLLFATLFSAINSAFLVYSLPILGSPTDKTNDLLSAILTSLRNTTSTELSPVSVEEPQKFATLDLAVNMLFCVSLMLSLVTAFFTVVGKQWLVYYSKSPPNTAENVGKGLLIKHIGVRRFRLLGVLDAILPVLIQLALFLFIVGFILFLVTINTKLSYAVIPFAAVGFLAYVATLGLASWNPNCPFQTPITTTIIPAFGAIILPIVFWIGQTLLLLLRLVFLLIFAAFRLLLRPLIPPLYWIYSRLVRSLASSRSRFARWMLLNILMLRGRRHFPAYLWDDTSTSTDSDTHREGGGLVPDNVKQALGVLLRQFQFYNTSENTVEPLLKLFLSGSPFRIWRTRQGPHETHLDAEAACWMIGSTEKEKDARSAARRLIHVSNRNHLTSLAAEVDLVSRYRSLVHLSDKVLEQTHPHPLVPHSEPWENLRLDVSVLSHIFVGSRMPNSDWYVLMDKLYRYQTDRCAEGEKKWHHTTDPARIAGVIKLLISQEEGVRRNTHCTGRDEILRKRVYSAVSLPECSAKTASLVAFAMKTLVNPFESKQTGGLFMLFMAITFEGWTEDEIPLWFLKDLHDELWDTYCGDDLPIVCRNVNGAIRVYGKNDAPHTRSPRLPDPQQFLDLLHWFDHYLQVMSPKKLSADDGEALCEAIFEFLDQMEERKGSRETTPEQVPDREPDMFASLRDLACHVIDQLISAGQRDHLEVMLDSCPSLIRLGLDNALDAELLDRAAHIPELCEKLLDAPEKAWRLGKSLASLVAAVGKALEHSTEPVGAILKFADAGAALVWQLSRMNLPAGYPISIAARMKEDERFTGDPAILSMTHALKHPPSIPTGDNSTFQAPSESEFWITYKTAVATLPEQQGSVVRDFLAAYDECFSKKASKTSPGEEDEDEEK